MILKDKTISYQHNKCLICVNHRAGADLQEKSPVADAKFDQSEGLWTISVEDSDKTFKARVPFHTTYIFS